MYLDHVFADTDMKAIVDLDLVSVEDCSSGACLPPSHHLNECPHVFDGAYCGNLGEAAALCVQEHEPDQKWEFAHCLLANNGWTPSGQTSGLSQDGEFDGVMEQCVDATLSNYSLDELKRCYTGIEGDSYRMGGYAKSSAKNIQHPTWLYVNGEYVGTTGMPDPTADLTEYAKQVKAKICGAYIGDLPSTCSENIQV